MACWGLWIGTYKPGSRRRYEWYAVDFALGVLLTAVLAALTVGSFLSDINVYDSFTIIRKTQIGYCGLTGCVLALGFYLLLGGSAIAGTSFAFPVALSLAAAISAVWIKTWFVRIPASPFLYPGVGIILVGIVLASYGYSLFLADKPLPPTEGRNRPKRPSVFKGLIVTVLAGLLLSSFAPLSDRGRMGPIETNVYLLVLLAGIGLFGTIIVASLFFINLPLQGAPLDVSSFIKGGFAPHRMGLMGGAIWCCGAICVSLARAASGDAALNEIAAAAFAPVTILLSAIVGVALRKEIADISGKARNLLLACILVMTVGAAMVGPLGFSRN